MTKSVDSELSKPTRQTDCERLEQDLWQNLANFMNTEVFYTIKRLLPADLKTLYTGIEDETSNIIMPPNPNPFASDFESVQNCTKGGFYVTENITLGW